MVMFWPVMVMRQRSRKPLMGTPSRLHLLHHFPQTGFIQRRIAEKIVDAELEALVIRCQRGQQPGAQPLVQRGRTAQRKDDLPLLPQHLGVLDDHAAKTGRKVRVRHKLRP